MNPKRVLIIGGTHGNEWTGIQVILHHQERLAKKFPKLELEFIFGNPRAHEVNRRFTEEDLNRAFQFLCEKRETFEHKRAQEILAQISKSPCFVIDLHTTTSNMGKTVILSHYEKLNCYVAGELSAKISDCRIIGSPDPQRKYLASQSPFGMMVEVGPIPNGIVEATALEGTLEILETTLELLSSVHEGVSGDVLMYEEGQDIFYPKDSKNQISAYIHSGFQGQDFQPINGKYTPFRSFSGEDLSFETSEELYPIFINEAAYYPQQLAFSLCRKKLFRY
jgi:succinylglutamate desuccinylase